MKLLVVEDDVVIADRVKAMLEAEGFTVEVANDGDTGYWMATESTFDLIVLDIMLPGRNGFVLCRDLRRAENWTPVLMLTAKDGDLDEAEGLDTGADDYLTKPFAREVLVARVRALLRRSTAKVGSVQRAGQLEVDSARRIVRCGGETASLTAREFDIVEFLVRRAGAVIGKDEVLAGVWDSDFEGDPNIVEVYIGRLRRKLGGCGAAIETVRGAGYRLADGVA